MDCFWRPDRSMDCVPRSCRTSRCCWWCRRGIRWRPARAFHRTRLARHPFVTGLRGSRYFELADAALRGIGIANVRNRHGASGVRRSEGNGPPRRRHCLLPACTVRAEIGAGSLVALKLSTDLPGLEIRYGSSAPLTGVARQFVSVIRRSRPAWRAPRRDTERAASRCRRSGSTARPSHETPIRRRNCRRSACPGWPWHRR